MKNTNNENNFPRRCYSKKQLATLYFPDTTPDTSVRHLFAWIKRCRPLMEQLLSLGYRPAQRVLSPAQVGVIIDFLGEPGDD